MFNFHSHFETPENHLSPTLVPRYGLLPIYRKENQTVQLVSFASQCNDVAY